MSPKKEQKSIDYIIDATNVCSWHAANLFRDKKKKGNALESFSLQPLLQLLILLKKNNKRYQCIFDANTVFNLPETEKSAYSNLLSEYKDFFYQVIGGIRADDFVLSLASRYKSSVISNDAFSDYHKTYPWLQREAKPQRLFKGGTPIIAGNRLLVIPDLSINQDLAKSTDELMEELTASLVSRSKRHVGLLQKLDPRRSTGQIVFGKQKVAFNLKELDLQNGLNVEFSLEEAKKKMVATDVTVVLENESSEELELLRKENKLLREGQVNDKYIGTIEWYDVKKKYGAIKQSDSDETIFFFSTGLEQKQLVPEKETEVIFEKKINKKGPYAANIRLSDPIKTQKNQSKELQTLKKQYSKLEEKQVKLEKSGSLALDQLTKLSKIATKGNTALEGIIELSDGKIGLIKEKDFKLNVPFTKSGVADKSLKLEKGAAVSFVLGSNKSGLIAKNIRGAKTKKTTNNKKGSNNKGQGNKSNSSKSSKGRRNSSSKKTQGKTVKG